MGIGTSNPAYPLHVVGSAFANNYVFNASTWQTSSEGNNRLYFASGSHTYISSPAWLIFQNSGTNVMIVDQGGNLTTTGRIIGNNQIVANGVGSNTSGGGNPGARSPYGFTTLGSNALCVNYGNVQFGDAYGSGQWGSGTSGNNYVTVTVNGFQRIFTLDQFTTLQGGTITLQGGSSSGTQMVLDVGNGQASINAKPTNGGSNGGTGSNVLVLNNNGGPVYVGGMLGVGTSTPTYPLHVAGSAFANNYVFNASTWHTSSEGSNRLYFTPGSHTYISSPDGLYFQTPAQCNVFSVDRSGNLTASGAARITSDSYISTMQVGTLGLGTSYAGFGHSNNNSYAFLADNAGNTSTSYINSGVNGLISFRHGNTSKMALSNGCLGIGVANPIAGLHVSTTVAGSNDVSGSYTKYLYLGAQSNVFTGSLTQGWSIISEQNVGISTGGLFVWSDERTKENISTTDSNYDLDILNSLRVCRFTYRDHVRRGKDLVHGFIAQEVKEVFPQAVSTCPGFLPDIYRPSEAIEGSRVTLASHGLAIGDTIKLVTATSDDLEAKVVTTGDDWFEVDKSDLGPQAFVFGRKKDDIQTLEHERFIGLAVSGIQTLCGRVETLEKRVTDLEAMNSKLTAFIASKFPGELV